jgi:membrane protease YdiL (CAAX protease family)
MNSRYVELFCLFILLPISLTLNIPIQAKFVVSILGIIYAIYISYKEGILKRSELFHLNGSEYWKTIWLRLIPTSLILLIFIFFYDKSLLFKVLLNKPGLFFIILFVYTFFSVFPQELIYRVFFFKRYGHFFKKEWVLILVNALLFSLAHIMFLNLLVSVLTFVGGLLFSLTYLRTKSYLMTSIEHTLYGLWLFTIGMGDMLAFPS